MLSLCHGKPGSLFFKNRRVRSVEASAPEEADEILDNPGCGTYRIFGYRAGQDAETVISNIKADTQMHLILLEINLRDFRTENIPEDELQKIDHLLEETEDADKELILRFLYDWDGQASQTEPDSIQVILQHMDQIGPVLLRHRSGIFTLQGLFTGNWGEMNGSRFSDEKSVRTLAYHLKAVTNGQIRLAVRTPAQWRIIAKTGQDDLTDDVLDETAKATVFGLFNDGMTGSSTDCGTYAPDSYGIYESKTDSELKTADLTKFNPAVSWPRDPELQFEERICRHVPDGGEAILYGDWNDLSQAIRSFRRMHVSYLNADYDGEVWKRWAGESTAQTKGMDGETYIKSRLGYRYVIEDAEADYHWSGNTISVSVKIANKGFAPCYQDLTAWIVILDSEDKTVSQTESSFDFRTLTGGVSDADTASLRAKVPAEKLAEGTYRMFLRVTDEKGEGIRLGNLGAVEDQDGNVLYPVGTVTAK